MSHRPCHFFGSPGGCRRGRACTFSHELSQAPSGGASPTPSNRSGPSRRSHEARAAEPPQGTCKFYWSSGRCRREFACRYRHLVDPSLASIAPKPTADPLSSAANTVAPFLTDSGLAKLNGAGTDVFFASPPKSMSPNEAHNALKRFRFDDFRFTKTFDIYGFLTPLNSATTANATWQRTARWVMAFDVCEDAHLFYSLKLLLTSVAMVCAIVDSSYVLLIIQREMDFFESTISFHGYLPLLRVKFYSSDFVVKSTLSHLVNGLYMRILDNFDTFCDHLETTMDQLMEAHSFKDPTASMNKDPLGRQVIASLSGVFYECLTHFKNVASMHPRILAIVRCLQN
ncbi:hypothetical protein Hypma_007678 [Hypsizygus marmoreus]|uniref:C3H1-type domain-containing protein n=1 Tax=Hypsizygus marmoreus TaxID=39966 RepID=A0A369JZ84_HYPMA|nr:hypothetical protein Hypma_007678 [Hypsizygus marmoreus]